ncbi:MAG: alpha-ketoglutarate-dependent dioxygenase AlkB [Steroidobacteraceae bacterium]
MTQALLFPAEPALPAGLVYQPDFLSLAEENELLDQLGTLCFVEARYKEWTARRRTVGYGARFDFDTHQLCPAVDIPATFLSLRDRIAAWAGLQAGQFQQMLINEYAPGTPLGWHRDAPCFEHVVGVSLAGSARMRLRPYPPQTPGRAACVLELAARSAYQLRAVARWDWQHAISPTRTLRYSITFRTLSESARAYRPPGRMSPTLAHDPG